MDEIREDYQIKIKNGEIGSIEKIPFICNIHGEYWQELYNHNNGHGCPECGKIKISNKHRKTDYPFMEEIRPDYQLKIMKGEIGCMDKIPFICKEHGEYWKRIHNYTRGCECPKCITKKFVKSRRKDYPFMDEIRDDYQIKIRNGEIGGHIKIPFICKEHGEYLQTLSNHSNGNGCPECGKISSNIKHRKTDYPFMDEIREDYREKIRNGDINNITKVPFICKDHGEYWQLLNNHSSGCGCPKCGYIKKSISRRKKDYPFMNEIRPDYRLKIIKGDINNITKIPFICKEHGEYLQSLNSHSSGQGCPKCGRERASLKIKENHKNNHFYNN
jgi:predicted RNA-binding Zn-ribbon protein involved in translation (DUF1610 family)